MYNNFFGPVFTEKETNLPTGINITHCLLRFTLSCLRRLTKVLNLAGTLYSSLDVAKFQVLTYYFFSIIFQELYLLHSWEGVGMNKLYRNKEFPRNLPSESEGLVRIDA